MENKENYFLELNSINLNEVKKKKGNLDYISWVWAWTEVKKKYPFSYSTVYENPVTGLPYFTDGKTCMVKVGMTVNGLEHIEWLHIMDYRNNSIPVDKVTSKDVNTAIQRATTKAIARHGIGLYVYAGEDLPEDEEEQKATSVQKPISTPPKQEPKQEPKPQGQNVSIDNLPTDKVTLIRMLEELGTNIDKVIKAYGREGLNSLTVEDLQDAYRRKINFSKGNIK